MSESLASDGSGLPWAESPGGIRASPPVLMVVLPSLLAGLFLLCVGKRGWRVTTGLGLALLLALAAWGGAVDAMGAHYIRHNPRESDLILAGLLYIGGALGLVLGATVLWPLGATAVGVATGLSIALGIAIVGDNGTLRPPWVFAVVASALGLVGLLAIAIVLNPAMAVSTSFVGAWMLCLGIDLLVNEDRGWSHGLRLALDYNPSHRPLLDGYGPPVSSRVLVGVAWLLGIGAGVGQLLVHRRPFIPTAQHQRLSSNETASGPMVEQGSISSDRAPSDGTASSIASLGAMSAITQRVRANWAGALSQWGSSIWGGDQSSNILAPFQGDDQTQIIPIRDDRPIAPRPAIDDEVESPRPDSIAKSTAVVEPTEQLAHARNVSQSTAEPSTRPQSFFSTLPRHVEQHAGHESDGASTIETSVPSGRTSCEDVVSGADDTFGLPPGDPGVLRTVRSASVLGSTSVASFTRSAHASAEGDETDDFLVPLYLRHHEPLGPVSLAAVNLVSPNGLIRGYINATAASQVSVRWTSDQWRTRTDTEAFEVPGDWAFEFSVGQPHAQLELALRAIDDEDGRERWDSGFDRRNYRMAF